MPRERTASQSSQPHRLPYPRIRFPLPICKKRQHCWDSRDSLGTVLSETVVCHEQLAQSSTAGIGSRLTSTCFLFTTLALTPTNIHHRHLHRGGMSKNTATDRVANSCHLNNTRDDTPVVVWVVNVECCAYSASWISHYYRITTT